MDIAHRRLHNQLIARQTLEKPGDVVRWMGAVQAQDYPAGLWAVGLRLPGATEADIEQAIADRDIVRTWPMRGTLHFVAPEDVRWMLQLLTPRIVAGAARRFLQLDLDDKTFARSKELFVNALQGGKQLSRRAMYEVLDEAGISAAGQRGPHILGRLAQEGLICFAVREGKQPTFALLDEWVPVSKTLERDEALAELARRYFTSHGPATLQDFAWWSGLKTADARAGLEMVKPELVEEVVSGQTYWLAPSVPSGRYKSPTAHLLPIYDEYAVAYKDRSAALDPAFAEQTTNGLSPTIVVDGRVVGTWGRTRKNNSVALKLQPLVSLSDAENEAIAAAANRYGKYLDVPISLS